MSEIVCRRPGTHEAEALCALMRQILMTSFPMFPPEAINDYLKPWTPDNVSSRLERGHDILIAAYAADEIIGLVSGPAPEAGVGTIVWLLVDQPWRDLRVGVDLYEAACDAYRNVGAH